MARLRSCPAGFAGSDGSSRRWSNDLGRRRSRLAGTGPAISALGKTGQSSGPEFPSRRWTRIPGATPRSKSLGAGASLGMFGSLISKRVPLPKFCSWKRRPAIHPLEFLQSLRNAFEAENRLHPRQTIPCRFDFSNLPGARVLAAGRCRDIRRFFHWVRTGHFFSDAGRTFPKPTQGKTLTVLEVDDLFDPISKFDGNVQTLGSGHGGSGEREANSPRWPARRGVDRIVKLGRMHVFVPPWDGVDLIRPMVRMVRHVCSTD